MRSSTKIILNTAFLLATSAISIGINEIWAEDIEKSDIFSTSAISLNALLVLLPMIITVISIAISLRSERYYGLTLKEITKLQKPWFPDFSLVVATTIVFFALEFFGTFLNFPIQQFTTSILGLIYSAVFAYSWMPFLIRSEKHIINVISANSPYLTPDSKQQTAKPNSELFAERTELYNRLLTTYILERGIKYTRDKIQNITGRNIPLNELVNKAAEALMQETIGLHSAPLSREDVSRLISEIRVCANDCYLFFNACDCFDNEFEFRKSGGKTPNSLESNEKNLQSVFLSYRSLMYWVINLSSKIDRDYAKEIVYSAIDTLLCQTNEERKRSSYLCLYSFLTSELIFRNNLIVFEALLDHDRFLCRKREPDQAPIGLLPILAMISGVKYRNIVFIIKNGLAVKIIEAIENIALYSTNDLDVFFKSLCIVKAKVHAGFLLPEVWMSCLCLSEISIEVLKTSLANVDRTQVETKEIIHSLITAIGFDSSNIKRMVVLMANIYKFKKIEVDYIDNYLREFKTLLTNIEYDDPQHRTIDQKENLDKINCAIDAYLKNHLKYFTYSNSSSGDGGRISDQEILDNPTQEYIAESIGYSIYSKTINEINDRIIRIKCQNFSDMTEKFKAFINGNNGKEIYSSIPRAYEPNLANNRPTIIRTSSDSYPRIKYAVWIKGAFKISVEISELINRPANEDEVLQIIEREYRPINGYYVWGEQREGLTKTQLIAKLIEKNRIIGYSGFLKIEIDESKIRAWQIENQHINYR